VRKITIDLPDPLSSGDAVDPYPLFFALHLDQTIHPPNHPHRRNTRVPDDHRRIWWWMERTRKPHGTGDAVAMRSVIKVPSDGKLHHQFSNAINSNASNSAPLEIVIFLGMREVFFSLYVAV